LQDIELAMVSQEVSERIYNLSSVGESVRLPLGVDAVEKVAAENL
jgi:hypothetical protein